MKVFEVGESVGEWLLRNVLLMGAALNYLSAQSMLVQGNVIAHNAMMSWAALLVATHVLLLYYDNHLDAERLAERIASPIKDFFVWLATVKSGEDDERSFEP